MDGSGNVYSSGISTASWGDGECTDCPIRAFSASGNDDAFAAKLDSTGALKWNTFLGGDGVDHSTGIAADTSGNVYIAGISTSTWGTPVRAFTGFNDDAFTVKLDTGGSLTWNTFLGGNGIDDGAGIAVDGSGNVYLTGISGETWGTPVRPFTGFNDDAFAAKLDSGGALTWNTFLGGSTPDRGAGVAADGNGNVYVTGLSDDTWGSPVRAFSGTLTDAFAAKLDSGGVLFGNTFLGGILEDEGAGIAVDGNVDVHITGTSKSTWGTPLRALTGNTADVFVAKIPAIESCARKPDIPLYILPHEGEILQKRRVLIDWADSACVDRYQLIVREGSRKEPKVLDWKLSASQTTTGRLQQGKSYFWRVIASNEFGKSKQTWRWFKINYRR